MCLCLGVIVRVCMYTSVFHTFCGKNKFIGQSISELEKRNKISDWKRRKYIEVGTLVGLIDMDR